MTERNAEGKTKQYEYKILTFGGGNDDIFLTSIITDLGVQKVESKNKVGIIQALNEQGKQGWTAAPADINEMFKGNAILMCREM